MIINKSLTCCLIIVLLNVVIGSIVTSTENRIRMDLEYSIYKPEFSNKIQLYEVDNKLFEINRKTNINFQKRYTFINNDANSDSDINHKLPLRATSNITTLFETSKLIASDGEKLDFFGLSVAIDHDIALVGSPGDDDACVYPLINSGAAYIYRFDGNSWIEEAKIFASDATGYDEYGYSVAVDNNVVAIGVPFEGWETTQLGAVYIYRFNGNSWFEEAKLVSPNLAECSHFGFSVSIQDDVVVIGAPYDDGYNNRTGAGYIYRFNGDKWVEEEKLTANDGEYWDSFGISVSISNDIVLIGANQDDDYGTESGSSYVFRYNDSNWSQMAKIIASDGNPDAQFGKSVSIDGEVALIGAHNDGNSGYIQGDGYGAAYVYRYDNFIWKEEVKLIASDSAESDWFGSSVSVSKNVALVTAPGDDDKGPRSGSSYLYRYNDGIWEEEAKLLASDGATLDCFGGCISLCENIAIIGASGDDDFGESSGAAYVFDVSEKSSDIEIAEIKGGLGISAIIRNKGTTSATNITWNINVTGGILGLIDKKITGFIPILNIDEKQKIRSGIFLGLGPIFITISASYFEGKSCLKTEEGIIFLFITRV